MSTVASQQHISIRDFSRNMTRYRQRVRAGESFVVMNQKEPDFIISPAQKKKKYTLADFKKIQFRSGEKNLSGRIDELLYG